jgi:ankyrin repeat protein
MMLFLIENGLNLEEKLAVVKELPLIWFSYKNNFSLVKALVDRGANVNIKSSDGDTPLMFAVSNDNYEMVRYLINHGANVKVQNNDGDTPVQLAGKNKNRKMLKFLIDCISTAPAA